MIARILVIIAGLGLSAWIVWYFWFSTKVGTKAAVSAEGVQEVNITVKGGYTPDVIVVQAGKPVRLNFLRQESSSCSEMVVFADFDRSVKLPKGETVPIEFTPEEPGEYEFTCQMGMIRGKLIVKA